jgi:nucleoside-triphosphatase THEP1
MDRIVAAIVGPVGAGKTTAICTVRDLLRAAGTSLGGVIQPALNPGRRPSGYWLEDAETGERHGFVTREALTLKPLFEPAGWAWAAARIVAARVSRDVLVVDELGLLESRGRGHMPALVQLVPSDRTRLWVLTVRDTVEREIEARLGGFDLVLSPSDDLRAALSRHFAL